MKGALQLLLVLGIFGACGHAAFAQERLSWEDCVKEAALNHPDLISAEQGVKQQEAGKAITASSLYPQVDLSANAATSKTSGGSGGASNSFSYGVSGSQLVFDGFKTVNNVKAASENVNASKQSYRFVSSSVRLALRAAFINLLRAQELIGVNADIAKIRRDNLVLISLRYQSGLEHKGALLTAEANVAQANFGLNQAKRDLELAQRQLTKEMGRTEFRPMFVRADFTVRDAPTERPDFEALLKNNPSLLQAVARKNAASFGIKSAYANFAPLLSGRAGADKSGSHWPPRTSQWNLGLGLSLPLFEGGLRHAGVSQAQAAYLQAQADERSTGDSVIVALEQTWVSLRDAVETVDVQRKTLDAAVERSRIAEAQYSIGTMSYDNWTIIEDDLVRAKAAYLDAQVSALLAEANWIQAKGETLEYEK